MDLEKANNIVNREALCQVLRMYDAGGKLLNGIKIMYVEGSESKWFRIDSKTRVYHVPLDFLMHIWTQ